jgi:DNA polymerase-3 subunit delta
VVRIRSATNALSKIFVPFLDEAKSEALIVVEAGELAKDSSLREAFEEPPRAASIACYLDSSETIGELLRSSLKSQGATIAPDALEEAVSLLGADRGTTRREVEKLQLYVHGRKSVTLEDVRAIMGDEAEARIEEVCDAAGEGDAPKLDRELERLWTAGVSPVGLVRVALGHFQRLALAKAQITKGENADTIIKRARPPIHFSRVPAFKVQLRNWSEERLGEALDLLLETEALCKTTAVPTEAACGRALITIAAWGKMGK